MEKPKIKIVFLGTPLFGAIILEEMIRKGYKPSLVIARPGPVKEIALKKEIKTADEKNIFQEIEKVSPDFIITAAYGKILPKKVLSLSKYNTLNIHPSLLPKYRGPSPIQYAILNNDKETGVSIFEMNEKTDEGRIAAIEKITISPNETAETLTKKLAFLASSLLLETIPKLIKKEIKLKEQKHYKATYTKLIKKEDCLIDWNNSAEEIERRIRALSGGFTFWEKNGKKLRIKIIEAEIIKEDGHNKGEVFLYCNYPAIKCLKGALVVKKMQVEGKKPVSGKDFMLGNKEFHGTILKT